MIYAVRKLFIGFVSFVIARLLWRALIAVFPRWLANGLVLIALQILISQIMGIPSIDEIVVGFARSIWALF